MRPRMNAGQARNSAPERQFLVLIGGPLMPEPPRLKVTSVIGIAVLVVIVAALAWVEFGGFAGCATGCDLFSPLRAWFAR
jgi:hypothetical protein